MSDPERLFRDAEGAALERVAHLEDENRRLRAEVERLRASEQSRDEPRDTDGDPPRPPPLPSHPLPGRFFVLAMALPLGLLSLLLAAAPHHHPRPHPHVVMTPYGEALVPHGVVRALPPTCTPPYTVDIHGDRHFKQECVR